MAFEYRGNQAPIMAVVAITENFQKLSKYKHVIHNPDCYRYKVEV